MNIHKRGIALSGRFCRLEHPSNIQTNTTQGRRQVPQVRIWNQTPPTEEDKYLKYESETKTPRRKTKTQKHRKHAVKTRSIPIATQEFTASKKRIHQPSNTRKKTLRHVKLQNITNSSKRQKYNENQKHITCSWNSLHHEETYCITKNTIHERRGEQKHTKSQLKLTTPTIKVNNTTDLQHQNMQQEQPNKLQLTLTATST